jgi:signal transduction histidine kinase
VRGLVATLLSWQRPLYSVVPNGDNAPDGDVALRAGNGSSGEAQAPVPIPETYERILAAYLETRSEAALYEVSLLSEGVIQSGLGPEDIIALHFETLDRLLEGRSYREQARAMSDAHQFLLEVMIAYGVRYKEFVELKLAETMRDAEASAARDRERALDAERADRQKSELLGVIAHELRTPLTAALGHLDLATRSLSRGQIERVPVLLGTAREALGRLSRLSADLVEASREGPTSLQMAPLDLGEIVGQACAWAEPAAVEHGVSLAREGGDARIGVLGSDDALLSVIGNLLSNAVRYTPEGGRVTVRQGIEAEWAWIEVSDTGIGMAPDVQARIFTKFYRAPDAQRLEAQGLGLGLSLVRQLVAAHRGRVEVRSAPGQGSTFRVMLPALRGSEKRGER